MTEIIVYRGEDILCVGTYKECSVQTGHSVTTLRKYGTPSHLAYVEQQYANRKPNYIVKRKYDRRLKKHRNKPNLFMVYLDEDKVYEGNLDEVMEFTGFSGTKIREHINSKTHLIENPVLEPVTVYRIEED